MRAQQIRAADLIRWVTSPDVLGRVPDLLARPTDLLARAADVLGRVPDLLARLTDLLAGSTDVLARHFDPPATPSAALAPRADQKRAFPALFAALRVPQLSPPR